jgi:hypothetical protein
MPSEHTCTARGDEFFGGACLLCLAAFTCQLAVTTELTHVPPEPALRGLVHAATIGLLVTINAFERHSVGGHFIVSGCAMAAVSLWQQNTAAALVLAAASAFVQRKYRPTGPVLLAGLGSALTLASHTLGPFEAMAAAFHRAFVLAIGASGAEGSNIEMSILFACITGLFATTWHIHGHPAAAVLAGLGAICELPSIASRLRDWPPDAHGQRFPLAELARTRAGAVCVVCALAYSGALLADAFSTPGPTFAAATRAIHVAAVLGFLLEIAPRIPNPLISKLGVALFAAFEIALCLAQLVPERSDTDRSHVLSARLAGALATGVSFAATAPAPPHPEPPLAAFGWSRWLALPPIAAYVFAHAAYAFARPTLEESVGAIFHFELLSAGFACWAAARSDKLAWHLALCFLSAESVAFLLMAPEGARLDLTSGSAALLLLSLGLVPAGSSPSFLAFEHDDDEERARAAEGLMTAIRARGRGKLLASLVAISSRRAVANQAGEQGQALV